MDIVKKIRDHITNVILNGGERVESAVSRGPAATVEELDQFIIMLMGLSVTLRAIVSGGCGDPDCPNCGSRPPPSGEPGLN